MKKCIEEEFRKVLPSFDAKKILSNSFVSTEMGPMKESMDAFVSDVMVVFKNYPNAKKRIAEAYQKYANSFFALHNTINEVYRKNRR